MNSQLLSLAASVIAKADREHPADAVLRTKLKEAKGMSRHEGRTVSGAVFAYYRWLGWLEKEGTVAARIQRAIDLNEAYRKDPKSVSDVEMKRAIPEWAAGEVEVSNEWLRTLQEEPPLWLRARPGKGKELAERLGQCWIGESGLPEAVRYEGEEDLFRTPEFQAGEFEVAGHQLAGGGVDLRAATGGDVVGRVRRRGRQAFALERSDAQQGADLGKRPGGMAAAKVEAAHGAGEGF